MENVNITSLKHLKEVINSIPDDALLFFQASDDNDKWFNWPMYIGPVHGNDKGVVIQICKPRADMYDLQEQDLENIKRHGQSDNG